MNKWTKLFLNGFFFQRSQNVPIDGPKFKEKVLQFAKSLIFRPLKLQMDAWIVEKKVRKQHLP